MLQTTSHPPAPPSDIGIMKIQEYGVEVVGISHRASVDEGQVLVHILWKIHKGLV